MADDTASLDRMMGALRDAETFTRAQVADLLGRAFAYDLSDLIWRTAYEAGYRDRMAQENAAYPPAPMNLSSTARQDAVRVHRSRQGVDVVAPREGDFPGMHPDDALTQFMWEADRPDPPQSPVSVRTRQVGRRLEWRDE